MSANNTERLIEGLVEELSRLEVRSDALSWDKARTYVAGYEKLANESEFKSLSGQKLTRRINQRLVEVAAKCRKQIPGVSFLSHSRRLADLWPQIMFGAGTKDLSYEAYRLIAVCSLPKEQKEELLAEAESTQPTKRALRQMVRTAVEEHNEIYKPDFELKVSNFWKFSSPHDNGAYGGIHPEVLANLLYWYTEPGDTVIDPMAGSGILANTLRRYRFFRESYQAEGSGPRIGLMSDIAPRNPDIASADATDSLPFALGVAALIVIDPPYLRVADGKQYKNIGYTLKEWLDSLARIIEVSLNYLRNDGVIAVITDDCLRKEKHVPIGFHIGMRIRAAGLKPCATIYNHNPNFIYSMGPAQMRAARKARLYVNGCKIIQIARQ